MNLPVKYRPRLPVKQREHRRVIRTKRGVQRITINQGYRPRQTPARAPIRPMPIRDWRSLIKPDTRLPDLRKSIEGEMLRKEIMLEKGEVVVSKVKAAGGELGFHATIEYLDIDGKPETITADIAGNPKTDLFVKTLMDAIQKGKRMIFHIKESNEPEPIVMNTGGLGQVMGMMAGTRKVDYIREFSKSSTKIESTVPLRHFAVRRNANGSVTIMATKNEAIDYSIPARTFKSEQAFRDANYASGKTPKDILGRRWVKQSTMEEF
jgi:hypothetical protein